MKKLVIALDGFDTPYTGCTTHLASLIVLKLLSEGAEFLDYPWLVRLNPAIPWKTRGNGAVVIQALLDNPQLTSLIPQITKLIKNYDVLMDKATAIILILDPSEDFPHCVYELYQRAVHTYVYRDRAHQCLKQLPVHQAYGIENRSLVGVLAAIGANLLANDHTFELITYRHPTRWLTPRQINEYSVIRFDYITGALSFLNYDYMERRILITPHGNDPVLYGVRGEHPSILLKALNVIEGEQPLHWTIFRTNQATNAHLKRMAIQNIRPYDNPIVEGNVVEKKLLAGGHVVLKLCDRTSCIWVAVYRETGRLNTFTRTEINPGTRIEVGGSVKPHGEHLSLNAEYIRVIGWGRHISTFHISAIGGRASINISYSGIDDIVLPSPSAFHHLMKPIERYIFTLHDKPLKPSTPIADLVG